MPEYLALMPKFMENDKFFITPFPNQEYYVDPYTGQTDPLITS